VQTFDQCTKSLRKAKKLGQSSPAETVGVTFTYISRIENGKVDFGLYPSEGLVVKLAKALDAAPDMPEPIWQMILPRPEALRKLTALDDRILDLVLAEAESLSRKRSSRRKSKSR
jgi:HTH-type transcriptional regulator, competence development regulator